VKNTRNISVLLKTINGATLEYSLPLKSTVSYLKSMVEERESIASKLQRIIFSGKELEDDTTLDFNSVRDRSQLFVVMRVSNVQVMVKTLKDRVFMVAAGSTTTVHDLKKNVNIQDPSWEVTRQRIIFQGKELADTALVTQCGLDEGTPTVHVVMRLPAPGTARRGKKEDVANAKADKGKKKGLDGATPVMVKDEPVETSDALNEFDDFLGSYTSLPMELDSSWAAMDESSPAEMPPSPRWDDCLKLPSLDTSSVLAAEAFSPPSPAAAESSTLVSTSFADMVANVKSEEGEELPMPSTQGRAYDLAKVDDKLRKRLLKNRLSAERSRQRKQAHVETLEFELSCCRSENEHLKKRVASLEAQLAAVSLNSPGYAPQRAQIAA